jgi:hypothetical protein
MITIWASALAVSDHQLLRPHAAAWFEKKSQPTLTQSPPSAASSGRHRISQCCGQWSMSS